MGDAIDTVQLQAAVEAEFGPADLVSDQGGESAVFRVETLGLTRIVKVSRFRDGQERARYLAAAQRQKEAVEAAWNTPFRPYARFLSQVSGTRTLAGGIPCKLERDFGSETLADHLSADFPEALFARPSAESVTTLMRDLARALGALHHGGYVHRDIKPDNISIRRTENGWAPMILDLGLVTRIGEATAGTEEGAGHRVFSRATQLNGGLAHPVDDLYSLGQILKMISARMSSTDGATFASLADEMIAERIANVEDLLKKLD